jgi:hypothetical protein
MALELKRKIISALPGARSFPASRSAKIDGYQRSLSGAPSNELKKSPGLAEPKTPLISSGSQ